MLDPGGYRPRGPGADPGNSPGDAISNPSGDSVTTASTSGASGTKGHVTVRKGETTVSSGTLTPTAYGGYIGLRGVGVQGDPIVALGINSYGSWTNPDGIVAGGSSGYGSYIAFFNSGPPLAHCGDPIKLSTDPTVGISRLSLLSEDTLFTILTLPATSVTLGGTNLNPGSTANTIFLGGASYSCTADMAAIGSPTGLRVEGWDTNGTTQVSLYTSYGADLQQFGSNVVGAIAAKFYGSFPKIIINPVGMAGPSNVVNDPGNAPIVVFSRDTGDPLPQVTVIPVTGVTYNPPFIDCIKFLSADVMLVSVEAVQTFDMLGQTFGKAGYSTLQIIKIHLSGATPTAQLVFSTDPFFSSVENLETTAMAVNLPNPDEVLWVGNSYASTPFTLPVRSPDGSAAFNIVHSGGSAEGYGVVFDVSTGLPVTVLKAFPGSAANVYDRIAKFSQCFANGAGYSIVGLCSASNSIIVPGDVEIPVFTGDPPEEIFFTTIVPTGVSSPFVSSSMTPDGHIQIEYSGTLETSTTLNPDDWTNVPNATSPYVIGPTNPGNHFFRTHN